MNSTSFTFPLLFANFLKSYIICSAVVAKLHQYRHHGELITCFKSGIFIFYQTSRQQTYQWFTLTMCVVDTKKSKHTQGRIIGCNLSRSTNLAKSVKWKNLTRCANFSLCNHLNQFQQCRVAHTLDFSQVRSIIKHKKYLWTLRLYHGSLQYSQLDLIIYWNRKWKIENLIRFLPWCFVRKCLGNFVS